MTDGEESPPRREAVALTEVQKQAILEAGVAMTNAQGAVGRVQMQISHLEGQRMQSMIEAASAEAKYQKVQEDTLRLCGVDPNAPEKWQFDQAGCRFVRIG